MASFVRLLAAIGAGQGPPSPRKCSLHTLPEARRRQEMADPALAEGQALKLQAWLEERKV